MRVCYAFCSSSVLSSMIFIDYPCAKPIVCGHSDQTSESSIGVEAIRNDPRSGTAAYLKYASQ